MDFLSSSLSDLATGGGIPALCSLSSAGDQRVWLALGGAAAGLGLAALERWRFRASTVPALQLVRQLLRLVLSAAQFFRMWDAQDPDIGAILVAIPLFFTACAPPTASLPAYVRYIRLSSAALNAVAVFAGAIYSTGKSESELGSASSAYDAGLRRALAVSDVAFAVSSPGWPDASLQKQAQSQSLWPAAARGLIFSVLSAIPWAARALLFAPQPGWLVFVYGIALVQSVHLHACCVRLSFLSEYVLDNPQRSLMLVVAPALAVSFSERAGDPAVASFAVLAAIAAGLLIMVLPFKFSSRRSE